MATPAQYDDLGIKKGKVTGILALARAARVVWAAASHVLIGCSGHIGREYVRAMPGTLRKAGRW
jgi:hypothetical protein